MLGRSATDMTPTGLGLHDGDEAEFLEGEVFGAALVFDEEGGVDAVAVVEVGEGGVLVEG